ncbi:transcriptional regulator [Echinicola strongylocentroti]|uniref:Transcriptional regulator n=1 Tax=Echinicola strongylocentroti TaxID=1795355 RepID=A0A2Z4IQ69_9BACT|nr:GntR family transcriptional regulator [Echinicola strongylocentroti]AWW32849.1 transcriptional regulator [Echinicola strongylocentroti]
MIIKNRIVHNAINESSRVPKYRQLAGIITQAIENGELEVGEKLPSITELHEETELARDTIVKALTYLKEKKIISSVISKGFYVARNVNRAKTRVLLVMNKLSSYKLKIYHSFVDALGVDYQVDLKVHHCNPEYLKSILEEGMEVYEHFVVMPHFNGTTAEETSIIDYLNGLPDHKLLLMDRHVAGISDKVPCIYQNFEDDIYFSLLGIADKLKKYDKLTLVFPEHNIYPYPEEIKAGFLRLCHQLECSNEIIDKVYQDMEFESNDAFIIIDEEDLVCFLQQVRDKKLVLGNDLGVISYNDTALKEVLGISVMTTDFEVMADSAAYMIKKKKYDIVPNYFSLIDRGSV